jgi:branched-subunit amino acid ABC-type transport system permease component
VLAIAEYVVRGALSGAIYALLAVPMSLMFVTVRTIDFAVGAYALIAAAVCWSVGGALGLAAGLAAAVACAALMAAIFLALKRLGCEDHIVYALASFGLATALASLVLWWWGTQAFVRDSFPDAWSLGGIRLAPQGVLNFALTLLLVGGLHLLIQRTSLGRMMRAAAANQTGAALAAIPVRAIQVGTYLAGGLLGGLAGLLVLYSAGLDFTAPLGLTLSGFGAAIIFGIGSPLRGFLGGLAMGIAQALAAGYASAMVAGLVPFLFVLLVLTTSRFGEEALAGGRP